jgi:50S ribosomal protein L16 3-hydroxylase
MPDAHANQLLGGLRPADFLRRHWQKQPLLVRQALPGFAGPLTRDELFALARDADVESRLVEERGGRWSLKHGPLAARDLGRRAHPWTVLVQGVNLHDDRAEALLRRFDFVPRARLDDLMVSYAVDGGGVGPHVDSYDVFLIQAQGRRRWRIGAQEDLDLVGDAPLKILKRFEPTEEWVLEPGDMLYLPPQYAHEGVAIGECMTCSVGFRAPSAQELAQRFLMHLEERIELEGIYADPDLAPTSHPGRIDAAMIDRVQEMLRSIRWKRRDVREFLGCYLTEPKRNVFFTPPAPALSQARMLARARRDGLRLDPKSQLLFRGRRFYLNGEALTVDAADSALLRALADRRSLPAGHELTPAAAALLNDWYRCGFLLLGEAAPR